MITRSSLPNRTWLYKHKPKVQPDPEPEVDEEVELLTEENDEEEWIDWENNG